MFAPLDESPADQSNWARVIVPPVAVPANLTVPTIVSALPTRAIIRVLPRLSVGSVVPLTVTVPPETPTTFQVPARQFLPLASQIWIVWSARLKKSELPPTMSSWPRPPKTTSLPALPSM